MELTELLEIWNKFLIEIAEKECNEEEEPFQDAVKKDYLKKRDEYLTTGPQNAGSAYPTKPKKSRSKSAPPGFGGS